MADSVPTTAEFQDILYERIGAVARISHHRPSARNAESTRLLDEMDAALAVAVADPEVGTIVIAGTGDNFSSGHDLKEAMAERADYTVEQRWNYEAVRYFGYALKIFDAPKPTIAQIQGGCIGGAFMVANMCDMVVASEDAFFADPVVRSLAAASVEVLVHPYVMGLRKAKGCCQANPNLSPVTGPAGGPADGGDPCSPSRSSGIAIQQP